MAFEGLKGEGGRKRISQTFKTKKTICLCVFLDDNTHKQMLFLVVWVCKSRKTHKQMVFLVFLVFEGVEGQGGRKGIPRTIKTKKTICLCGILDDNTHKQMETYGNHENMITGTGKIMTDA